MSFVLFAGCQYFGMMIGDRRSLDANDNIKSEDEIKVRKINNNVVTCAGGSEDLINVIWRTVLGKEFSKNITYQECIDIFKKKCNDIREEYLQLIKVQYLYTSIGIMGFKNDIICLTDIEFLEDDIIFRELEYKTATDTEFVYFATGITQNAKDIYLRKFKRFPIFTLENLKSIFYQTAHECMKRDNSINDRYVMEYIERKDLIERDKVRIDK